MTDPPEGGKDEAIDRKRLLKLSISFLQNGFSGYITTVIQTSYFEDVIKTSFETST